MNFFSYLQLALYNVIGYVGEVISALVIENNPLHELLPLLAIGVSVSCLFLGIKVIKTFLVR